MELESTSITENQHKAAFPPSVRTRRATIACTRCRRYRNKCKQTNSKPPCVGCQEAGPAVAESCKFVGRCGKRIAINKNQLRRHTADNSQITRQPTSFTRDGDNDGNLEELVPREEIIEACKLLINNYFQLGFLPKVLFLARLENDFNSVNQFLLTCILAISSRFTTSLIKRFGSPTEAVQVFTERAEQMISTEIYKPTIETIQGMILLSTAEWANGDCNKSLIHLGVASTMAGMLRLHREDTYNLPKDAQPEDVIYSEMARRTLWVMGIQRNLFAGQSSPLPFCLSEITALLPCEENEFAFGIVPNVRAALPKSKAALENPDLVSSPSRSLFATLIQAYKFWGQVARRAFLDTKDTQEANTRPWESTSQYSKLSKELDQWEAEIPQKHRWSEWYLKVYKVENLDLAYVSIFLCIRLSNIVLRRSHLVDIKSGILSRDSHHLFWRNMAQDLFTDFISLHEGITAYLANRALTEGFPPILAFSVYLCGSLALHLWKCPQLCPQLAPRSEDIFRWSLKLLLPIGETWHMAASWLKALTRASTGLSSLHLDSLHTRSYGISPHSTYSDDNLASDSGARCQRTSQSSSTPNIPSANAIALANSDQSYLGGNGFRDSSVFSLQSDDFESELASFMQEGFILDLSADWNS